MCHRILTIICALLLPLAALLSDDNVDEKPPYPRAIISTSLGDITVELYPDSAPQTVEIFLGLASGERPWRDPKRQEMVTRPYYDGTTFHRVIPGFMIQGGDILGTGSGGAGFTFADEINASGLGLDTTFAVHHGQPHRYIAGMPNVIGAIRDHYIQPALLKRGIGPDSPQAQQHQAISEAIAELDGTLTVQELYERMGYRYDSELKARPPITGSLCLANRGPNTNSGQFFINVGDTPHLRGLHTVFGHVVAGMDVVRAISEQETDGQARPKTAVTITSIRLLNDEQDKAKPEDSQDQE